MHAPLNILVVEDEPADFRLVERHLSKQGLAALCTCVSDDAALADNLGRDGWDLALCDYKVPGMDFGNTLELIHARLPELPVILLSGSIGEERAVELLKRGVAEFVLKDNLLRLVPAIERTLREARESRARREAEAEILRSREQLRALMARQDSLLEEERTRIARELHDDLGQRLIALKLDLAWLAGRLAPEQGEFVSHLARSREHIDATLGSMRRIAASLRPLALDDLGLNAAIEWLVEDFARRTGLSFSLDQDTGPDGAAVPPEMAGAVFRIVQESLTNVAKHANASRIGISVLKEGGALLVEVQDDGRGLVSGGRPGLGMLGMRERAALCGGSLEVGGAPGAGTTVRLVIPLAAMGEAAA